MNDMLLTFEVINNEYIGIGLKVRKNFANNWGISALVKSNDRIKLYESIYKKGKG